MQVCIYFLNLCYEDVEAWRWAASGSLSVWQRPAAQKGNPCPHRLQQQRQDSGRSTSTLLCWLLQGKQHARDAGAVGSVPDRHVQEAEVSGDLLNSNLHFSSRYLASRACKQLHQEMTRVFCACQWLEIVVLAPCAVAAAVGFKVAWTATPLVIDMVYDSWNLILTQYDDVNLEKDLKYCSAFHCMAQCHRWEGSITAVHATRLHVHSILTFQHWL